MVWREEQEQQMQNYLRNALNRLFYIILIYYYFRSIGIFEIERVNIMLSHKRNRWSFGIYVGIFLCLLMACNINGGSVKDTKDYLQAGDQDMQSWRQLTFGLFWGKIAPVDTSFAPLGALQQSKGAEPCFIA